MAGVNFKSEEDVRDFLKNLLIEYQFGCHREKKPEVCHLLGDYFEAITRDMKGAADVYKTNCDENDHAHSCRKFGGYASVGRGMEKNVANINTALKYFEKGCKLGDGKSCFSQGYLLTSNSPDVSPDFMKGVECLKISCDKEVSNACNYLSGMYITGVRKDFELPKKDEIYNPNDYYLKSDMKQAFKYAQMGCKLNDVFSCHNLSHMYSTGQGTEKNITLGAEFKKLSEELKKEIEERTINFQQGL